jgi:hypothetical protein
LRLLLLLLEPLLPSSSMGDGPLDAEEDMH